MKNWLTLKYILFKNLLVLRQSEEDPDPDPSGPIITDPGRSGIRNTANRIEFKNQGEVLFGTGTVVVSCTVNKLKTFWKRNILTSVADPHKP